MHAVQLSSYAVRIEQYSSFTDGRPTTYTIVTRDASGNVHTTEQRYTEFLALHLTLPH